MIKVVHIHEDKEKTSLKEGEMDQGCTEGEMRRKPASIKKRGKMSLTKGEMCERSVKKEQ